MTRKDLQDALVKETKELLKDVWAKNSLGEDVQAQVFPQRLPVMTEDEDDETKLFPYAIVRLQCDGIHTAFVDCIDYAVYFSVE